MRFLNIQKVRRWMGNGPLQKGYNTEYEVVLTEKGEAWEKVLRCKRKDLEDLRVEAPVKLTTFRRFKLTRAGRFKLTTRGRSKLTT